MRHPEALLLVDHHQPQVLEGHVPLQQPVRADGDVDGAARDAVHDGALLVRRAEARQHRDLDGEAAHALAEGLPVLLGEHRGGHEHGHLPPRHHRLEGGAHGHLRLPVAHVARDEAVHRLLRLHVRLHVRDRLELVGRLHEGERALHLDLPGAVFGAGVAPRHRPPRVQVEQLLRDLRDCAPHAPLRVRPLLRAQPRERWRPVARPHVGAHRVELVRGNVEAVALRVFELQVLALDAVRRPPREPREARDAVVDVHDRIARLQRRQQVRGDAAPPPLGTPRAPQPEHLLVADQRERLPQQEAAARRRGHDRDRAGRGRLGEGAQQARLRAFLLHQVGETQRLLGGEHDGAPLLRPRLRLPHHLADAPPERRRRREGQPFRPQRLRPEAAQFGARPPLVQPVQQRLHLRRSEPERGQPRGDLAAPLQRPPRLLLVTHVLRQRLDALLPLVHDDQRVRREPVEGGRAVQQGLEVAGEAAALAARQQLHLLRDRLRALARDGDRVAQLARPLQRFRRVARERRERRRRHPLDAALRRQVDAPDALDLVAEELDAQGLFRARGEHVEDAAAPRGHAGRVRERLEAVARRLQRALERFRGERRARAHLRPRRFRVRPRAELRRRRPRRRHDAAFARAQLAQGAVALGDGGGVVLRQFVGEPLARGQPRDGQVARVERQLLRQQARAPGRRHEHEGGPRARRRQRRDRDRLGRVGRAQPQCPARARQPAEAPLDGGPHARQLARHVCPNAHRPERKPLGRRHRVPVGEWSVVGGQWPVRPALNY